MKEYWQDLSTGKKMRMILTIILSLSAIIFAARNWRETEVILVFLKVKMPLTLVIVISAGIGFALASLFDYRKFKARDVEIKRLNNKLLEQDASKKFPEGI